MYTFGFCQWQPPIPKAKTKLSRIDKVALDPDVLGQRLLQSPRNSSQSVGTLMYSGILLEVGVPAISRVRVCRSDIIYSRLQGREITWWEGSGLPVFAHRVDNFTPLAHYPVFWY